MIVPAEKKFAVSHDASDALRNNIYTPRLVMHPTQQGYSIATFETST